MRYFTVATDGICIIANNSNPIDHLTKSQLIDIYTGKINRWLAVGGEDSTITVVNKAQGRATLDVFLRLFHLKVNEIKAQVIIGDNEQGIKTIAGNPLAIGYVSVGTAQYHLKNNTPIKIVAVEGIDIDAKNTQNTNRRELNLVTAGDPHGLAKQFIDYARSEAVYDLVRSQYFVPIAPR